MVVGLNGQNYFATLFLYVTIVIYHSKWMLELHTFICGLTGTMASALFCRCYLPCLLSLHSVGNYLVSNRWIVILQFYTDVVLSQLNFGNYGKLNLIFEMTRVVFIFSLYLLCVMHNGFSHAQFQLCTISVIHHLVIQSAEHQRTLQKDTFIVPLSNTLSIFLIWSLIVSQCSFI